MTDPRGTASWSCWRPARTPRRRVQPIFDAIGRRDAVAGAGRQRTRLKLALNNWLVTQVEAVAETLALTEALGVDPQLLVDAVADGPLGSTFAVAKANAMLAHDFAPGFPLRHALKDAMLALSAARDQDLELPLTDALAQRWEAGVVAGHGDQDVSVGVRRGGAAVAAHARFVRRRHDPLCWGDDSLHVRPRATRISLTSSGGKSP